MTWYLGTNAIYVNKLISHAWRGESFSSTGGSCAFGSLANVEGDFFFTTKNFQGIKPEQKVRTGTERGNAY